MVLGQHDEIRVVDQTHQLHPLTTAVPGGLHHDGQVRLMPDDLLQGGIICFENTQIDAYVGGCLRRSDATAGATNSAPAVAKYRREMCPLRPARRSESAVSASATC